MNNQLNWKLLGLAGMMMLWPLFGAAQVNLDSGLVAYYPFNGNANDESGNGLNGIVSGAKLVADRFGQDSSAYEFDDVDDFIEVPNTNDLLSLVNEWTISFWVNPYSGGGVPPGTNGFAHDPIISKLARNNTNEDNYLITWDFKTDTMLHSFGCQLERNDDADFHAYSDSLPPNDDYHVVLRLNVDKIEFFVNAIRVDSTNVGANFIPYQGPAPMVIGNSGSRSASYHPSAFHGIIDDIRIYRRPLNQMEIDSLYNENVSTTSIEDGTDVRLLLFPNPSPGTFTLRSPQAVIQSLTLYDLTGRRIPAEISHDRHEAQVRSSYRGIALVKVQTDHGMWVQKVRME
jgi:hypothetical protein